MKIHRQPRTALVLFLTLLGTDAGAAITTPVTLDFEGLFWASYGGNANLAPEADGSCSGSGPSDCYYEDGFAIGTNRDSFGVGHLHKVAGADGLKLGYHADSAGIYIRTVDGSAFSLDQLDFHAPTTTANPDAGADDYWEVLGFSTAVNPDLHTGNGTDHTTRVAHQTVANGFDGTVVLNSAFADIRAFWIHYHGYPDFPLDGKFFEMSLDNVQLSAVAPVPLAALPLPAAALLFAGVLGYARRNARLAHASAEQRSSP